MPWKPTTVRLDTYSGAPVDFSAFEVDPADVIVAGRQRQPRAIDTRRRRAVVRWRFSPPPGYRFESNDVGVPLGSREGFFVIEARRGAAVQQVWLNRTHIGLVTQESPGGLVLWTADLRGGRALSNVPIDFLVGATLVRKATDRAGVIVWRDARRPSFVLAQSGAARAFVSLLPQAPPPVAIVGLRLESSVARAGDAFRFAGFARTRTSGRYVPAKGDTHVSLIGGRGTTLGSAVVRLDPSGAFSGSIVVPSGTAAGDYTVLAAASRAAGGTTLHVDAATDVALAITNKCPCDAASDVPLRIAAKRDGAPAAGVPIHVQIVRSPHVAPPGVAEDAERWGTTVVYDRTLQSDANGRAKVTIETPSDGLDSTYGIYASTSGATATSRLIVAAASLSLAVEPEATSADVGEPVAFDVRGFDPTDGSPAASLPVVVRLSHGASEQSRSVVLDARGRVHVVFKTPSLGSNLVVADATVNGKHALDVAAIKVEPSALAGRTAATSAGLDVTTDKPEYRPNDRAAVTAKAPGAAGDALVSLTGVRTYLTRTLPVSRGTVATTFGVGDPLGSVVVSAAFVRDGAIALGSVPVAIAGDGRAIATHLTLDRPTYAPGDTMHVTIHDGAPSSTATIVLRVADGRESGGALFDDSPDALAAGATTIQAPASDDPEWHAYVAPAASKANDIFAAERPRRAPAELPSLGSAAPATLYWHVARGDGDTYDVPAPTEAGHYVLSVMRIADDGDVGATSGSFNVK